MGAGPRPRRIAWTLSPLFGPDDSVAYIVAAGDLTQAERSAAVVALKQRTAMPNVHGERPKALLLKACYEMGRLRPTPPEGSSVLL